MAIAVTTLAAFSGISTGIELPNALQSGGLLWALTALALAPLLLVAMRRFRAAFIPPLIFVGYLKTAESKGFSLTDPTVIALLLLCAILLSIKLLYGINDASLFDPTGHPLTSESREVTQIGAGQAVGFALLWLLFCTHYGSRRLSLLISVPLLCAALIASVARGP